MDIVKDLLQLYNRPDDDAICDNELVKSYIKSLEQLVSWHDIFDPPPENETVRVTDGKTEAFAHITIKNKTCTWHIQQHNNVSMPEIDVKQYKLTHWRYIVPPPKSMCCKDTVH